MDDFVVARILAPAPVGAATCVRVDVGGVCGKPAAWHVLWEPASNGIVASICARHYALDCEHMAIHDVHPFGGQCNMPGAKWIDSTPGHPGTCAIPLEDDVHEEVHESVLASAGAGL